MSIEDGVEVVMQDNVSSTSEKKCLDKAEKTSHSPSTFNTDQTESLKPSISFEAQVGHCNRFRCF